MSDYVLKARIRLGDNSYIRYDVYSREEIDRFFDNSPNEARRKAVHAQREDFSPPLRAFIDEVLKRPRRRKETIW